MLVPELDTTGGGGRFAVNLSEGLRRAGHEVEVLSYKEGFWRFVKKARASAKHADIVHAFDINPLGIAGYLATRFTKAKLIITAQGTYAVAPLYSRKMTSLSKVIYRAADAVVAISRYTASEIRKKVPSLQMTIIDPGIDMSKFVATNAPAERTSSPLLMIGVGSVKARKGYDVTLRAFVLAKKDIPNLRYAIVGTHTDEPGYAHMLIELARELGVEKDVDFLTKVSDAELNALYDRASLFILTSVNESFHFEGFGMVFLEAAAHGLPTIGTSGNGIADAIEDGKTGILVPQRDVEATAKAIVMLFTDQNLAMQMGARGHTFAADHDQKHIARRYGEVYQGAVSHER